jgi:hypothetical protein
MIKAKWIELVYDATGSGVRERLAGPLIEVLIPSLALQ